MSPQDPKPKSPMMLLFVIAVLVISTLVMISNYFLRPRIENDLANKVMTSLNKHKIFYAAVKVEGRDVIINGVTSDQQQARNIEIDIQNISGVNQVENNLLIKNQTIE